MTDQQNRGAETADDQPTQEQPREVVVAAEEEQEQNPQPPQDENEKRLEENKYSPLNLRDQDFESEIMKWTKITPKCPPKRRTRHSSFVYSGKLYIVGGIDITEKKQDDIYYINLAEPTEGWKKVELQGDIPLQKIAYHAGARIGSKYYIVGGQSESLKSLNTIQVFNITGECMEEPIQLDQEKFPGVESHTVCVHDRNNLVIYGGKTGKELNRHIYVINLETQEVTKPTEGMSDDQLPPPRTDHAACMNGGVLYVFGGFGPDSKYYDDMWRFDFGDSSFVELKTEKQREEEQRKKEAEEEARRKAEEEANRGAENEQAEAHEEVKQEEPVEPEKPLIMLNERIIDGGEKYDDDLNEDPTIEQREIGDASGGENEEKKPEENAQASPDEGEEGQEGGEQGTGEEEKKAEEVEDITRPKGRSGHTMTKIGGCFYIFGGKTDLIKESNELWKFDPASVEYTLIHDTLLIQFTEEELKKISQSDEKGQKPFHWLTRGEVEKRTNPSFNDKVKSKKKKKGAKDKNKKNKNQKGGDDDYDDTEGKFSDQVLHRPNVIKMRKTLIFTSEPSSIKNGLVALENDEKATLAQNIYKIRGEVPEPRDGQTVVPYKGKLYVFGGDRFKFPFNDLFTYDAGGDEQEDEEEEEVRPNADDSDVHYDNHNGNQPAQ